MEACPKGKQLSVGEFCLEECPKGKWGFGPKVSRMRILFGGLLTRKMGSWLKVKPWKSLLCDWNSSQEDNGNWVMRTISRLQVAAN